MAAIFMCFDKFVYFFIVRQTSAQPSTKTVKTWKCTPHQNMVCVCNEQWVFQNNFCTTLMTAALLFNGSYNFRMKKQIYWNIKLPFGKPHFRSYTSNNLFLSKVIAHLHRHTHTNGVTSSRENSIFKSNANGTCGKIYITANHSWTTDILFSTKYIVEILRKFDICICIWERV